jgi:hypothetical protein
MQVDKPLARSLVSALNVVAEMTVLGTTGCPDVLMTNVPEPLKAICVYSYS